MALRIWSFAGDGAGQGAGPIRGGGAAAASSSGGRISARLGPSIDVTTSVDAIGITAGRMRTTGPL